MNILEKIFSHKKEELEHFKHQRPLVELKAAVGDLESTRGFERALREASQKFAIIAEIKKRSPSKGLLREDFEPLSIATSYQENGATCLSVLTDERFFGGSLDYLKRVHEQIQLPILRKDFLWEPYQIYEAREAGADAILLIAAMLETSQMEDLQGLAKELSLDVLMEVHDEEETMAVRSIKATLIGVNNRNLKDFSVSLETSKKLFPLMETNALKVSESGLSSAKDLEDLTAAGAGAFLIGESLMRETDPGQALAEFLE